MGNDGAGGLLNMRKNGALTIAQDDASSIMFGMSKEAIDCGGAQKIVPLLDVAGIMINLANRQVIEIYTTRFFMVKWQKQLPAPFVLLIRAK